MHALEKFGLAPLASFGTSTSSALLCGVCAAVGTYLEPRPPSRVRCLEAWYLQMGCWLVELFLLCLPRRVVALGFGVRWVLDLQPAEGGGCLGLVATLAHASPRQRGFDTTIRVQCRR